jgi:hypothetical protein
MVLGGRSSVPEDHASKDEIIRRLMDQYRKLLEEKLPDEPGTLEEIELITEEIGNEVKQDIENECVSYRGTGYVGWRVSCCCGGVATFKCYKNKRQQTLSSELVISRAYYYCKSCGHGFAPLDSALGLDGLCTSVGVRTKVARLTSWMPFDEVSTELAHLCGIHVSRNSARRISESMGERIRQAQHDHDEQILSGLAQEAGAQPQRVYVATDGVHVPMRDGEWREAKTGVVYETYQREDKVLIKNPEYVATLERVDSFAERVYARAYDRGVESAREVVTLGDGAAWIWKSFSHHYPGAVQILDFYHASEHLNEVARAWYGDGTDQQKRWVEARQTDLLSDSVETVIRSMQSWHPTDPEAQDIRRRNMAYFKVNKERMRYATFTAQGYHIGSGLVESACKMVVGQRLKQAGMRWSEPGAEQILQLRSFLLSHRNADLRPYARSLS